MAGDYNSSLPLTFTLPDGDIVELITWDYVVNKFDNILTPIIKNISAVNADIERINSKIDIWLAENETS